MKITAAVWPVRHVQIFWGTSSIRVAFSYRDFSWKQSKHNLTGHGMSHTSPVFTTAEVKWSCYRPGVAQRVGRGIALLFHDHGSRRGWVVSSTPWPHFTPRKDPVPILQEAGWAPGLVWTGGKSRPHRDSIPDHPAHSRYTDWATRPTFTTVHTEIVLHHLSTVMWSTHIPAWWCNCPYSQ